MLKEWIGERNLPPLLSREKMLDILSRHEYGVTPPKPEKAESAVLSHREETYGGKGIQEKIEVRFHADFGDFAFPFDLTLPMGAGPYPLMVFLDFSAQEPNPCYPQEEILDAGVAVARLRYTDIVNDNGHGDFSDGLGLVYYGGRARGPEEWGKIGMWAYGASRVVDALWERKEIDKGRIGVLGLSRLGKTSLWAGAQDERFSLVAVNDSGCGGASLFRGAVGEDVASMRESGLWEWFCENYKSYAHRQEEMPFDQHYVLACVAPRKLAVGSADRDQWCDTVSEFLGTVAASPAWERGLICPDRLPQPGEDFGEGSVAYHLRRGTHYLCREDWEKYIRLL